MSYPTVTIDKAQELASLLRPEVESLLAGGDPFLNFADEADWVTFKNGEDYPRNLIEKCASDLKADAVSKIRKAGALAVNEGYLLEATMAGPLHSVLRQCAMDMLEDEDFWRYLALFPFRWFLIAREPELQPQDFGGYAEIQDEDSKVRRRRTKSMITQLIYRTYLWGKISYDESQKNSYARATLISEIGGPVIDIWHSHLIRTQLGQLGVMPHSFLDVLVSDVEDPSQMKFPARETEKLVARVKHNVLLDVYQKDDADSIIREQLNRIK